MAYLYRLDDYRKSARRVFFSRRELNQLLSLYSRRVTSGEWRDYAIDQIGAAAVFSVYRHSHDQPLFSIAKQGVGQRREFVVFAGRRKVLDAGSLSEALEVFDKSLRVVS